MVTISRLTDTKSNRSIFRRLRDRQYWSIRNTACRELKIWRHSKRIKSSNRAVHKLAYFRARSCQKFQGSQLSQDSMQIASETRNTEATSSTFVSIQRYEWLCPSDASKQRSISCTCVLAYPQAFFFIHHHARAVMNMHTCFSLL